MGVWRFSNPWLASSDDNEPGMPTDRNFIVRGRFLTLAEIEPATKPDLQLVREQIAVLAPVADAFLVPDNHLGRATVSSLAVAREVAAVGGRSIACLNARDRNLLGLRRDLLTAAAYGVDHLLLVQGDAVKDERPVLTTSVMFQEARSTAAAIGLPGLRLGVTARAGSRLPSWKLGADFVLAQISFDLGHVARWRANCGYDGPVLLGVIVLNSAAMARRLSDGPYGISIPNSVIERLHDEPGSGMAIAMETVEAVRASGCADGVHLISGGKYREAATALLLARVEQRAGQT